DSPDSTPATKSALEVLLFVLAEGELDAEGEFEDWYKTARQNWSMRLDAALMKLDPNSTITDKASALAETWEIGRGSGVGEGASTAEKAEPVPIEDAEVPVSA